MNTNKVNKAEAKGLYPMLPITNKKRIVTANYYNIIVLLPGDEANLLNFLLKECTVFNTIKYSTKLMMRYRAYIKAIERNFKHPTDKISLAIKKQPTNIHATRDTFMKLIEKGLIFRVDKEYMINFALSYMVQFSAPASKWTRQYGIIQEKGYSNSAMYAINKEILTDIKK